MPFTLDALSEEHDAVVAGPCDDVVRHMPGDDDDLIGAVGLEIYNQFAGTTSVPTGSREVQDLDHCRVVLLGEFL